MADILETWHLFYGLLGGASATMVGLLFVAASVGAGVFSSNRPSASRVFMSASVVHFSSILITCLIILAPHRSPVVLGLMITGSGGFGLAYCGVAWRGTMRDGLLARIDFEDRAWYVVVPVLVYFLEAASGLSLVVQMPIGYDMLALSLGSLLVVALHNAWDITIWTITRPRE